MIIAIDGPAGTGKSTIASIIAKRLNITYLNSGSFYRGLTLSMLKSGMDLKFDKNDESKIVEFCKKQNLSYKNGHLFLNGEDVEDFLHDDSVSKNVAQVSAIVEIRHLVNEKMKEITKSLDIVCEGRDMTTVVFPNAEYKFYLDASLDVQAQRRFNQGVSKMSLEEIKESIRNYIKIFGYDCDLNWIDTSNVTDMSYLFDEMRSFTGNVSEWDVSNVT